MQDDAFTAMDLFTLVVAVLGAVTAVASLRWAIISRQLDRGAPHLNYLSGTLTPAERVSFRFHLTSPPRSKLGTQRLRGLKERRCVE